MAVKGRNNIFLVRVVCFQNDFFKPNTRTGKRALTRAQKRTRRRRTTMYRGYWYSGLNVSTVYMYQLYCKGTPPVECDTRSPAAAAPQCTGDTGTLV